MQIYTCIHPGMFDYTHTYTHTCMLTYLPIHKHIYAYTFMHSAYIQTFLNAYNIYVCLHSYTYAYIHRLMHVCACTFLYLHMYIHMYEHKTFMFAYKHAWISTFLPRNRYNFRINCFHKFHICIFPDFLNLHTSENVEIWKKHKFCKCGN